MTSHLRSLEFDLKIWPYWWVFNRTYW